MMSAPIVIIAVLGNRVHTRSMCSGGYRDPMRALIVEDELFLAEAVRDGLRLGAIAADIAGDRYTALEINDYDVVVLDRDIPGPHGDTISRHLAGFPTSPRILMVTAADHLDDKNWNRERRRRLPDEAVRNQGTDPEIAHARTAPCSVEPTLSSLRRPTARPLAPGGVPRRPVRGLDTHAVRRAASPAGSAGRSVERREAPRTCWGRERTPAEGGYRGRCSGAS